MLFTGTLRNKLSGTIAHMGRIAAGTTFTGVVFVLAGVTFYAIMDGIGVFLSATQNLQQIVWARYAFAVPVVLTVVAMSGGRRALRSSRPFTQGLMGLLPMLASFSVAGGFGSMSLPELTALTFASPLLVVALSAPLLREHTTRHDWIGVTIGFIGILIVVRPGTGAIAWPAAFPLGCAFFFALYQIAMRFVGRMDDAVTTLVWTIGTGLLVTTPLVVTGWQPVEPSAWAAMVGSGLAFGGAQLCLIQGFRRAAPATLSPFTYAQILPATLIGVLAFGSRPDIWVFLGAAVIIASGIYILRNHRGAVPPKAPAVTSG